MNPIKRFFIRRHQKKIMALIHNHGPQSIIEVIQKCKSGKFWLDDESLNDLVANGHLTCERINGWDVYDEPDQPWPEKPLHNDKC